MIEQGGNLPLDLALTIFFQCLDGLAYAHVAEIPKVKLLDGSFGSGRGLVHRDLKPANIYLSGSGSGLQAKLGDFGLSKSFDMAGLSGQTVTGSAAGSPSFMPRQQMLNFKYAKPEIDVWAMAACFYNMVTGQLPREKTAGMDPCQMVLRSPIIPIRKRNRAIPVRLAKVIDTALIDRPKIIMKSAQALKQAIEATL